MRHQKEPSVRVGCEGKILLLNKIAQDLLTAHGTGFVGIYYDPNIKRLVLKALDLKDIVSVVRVTNLNPENGQGRVNLDRSRLAWSKPHGKLLQAEWNPNERQLEVMEK